MFLLYFFILEKLTKKKPMALLNDAEKGAGQHRVLSTVES